ERLFAAAGFRVCDLSLVYSGQYLHLVAEPAARASEPAHPVAPILKGVESFQVSVGQAISRWHSFLRDQPPGSVALWGSGSKATGFLTTVGSHDKIDCVVDINPDKHGRFVAGSGHEIVAPATLCERNIETLIIMNPIYEDEIRRDVQALCLNPRMLAL
ncbi:MAG: SAM-dependent methyltransferase, partial [Planctomycetes bacterium]|nr:SAM-dependent methyltransferase [Planctomycetota bacterium]